MIFNSEILSKFVENMFKEKDRVSTEKQKHDGKLSIKFENFF
jgi:hypothetical protein